MLKVLLAKTGIKLTYKFITSAVFFATCTKEALVKASCLQWFELRLCVSYLTGKWKTKADFVNKKLNISRTSNEANCKKCT